MRRGTGAAGLRAYSDRRIPAQGTVLWLYPLRDIVDEHRQQELLGMVGYYRCMLSRRYNRLDVNTRWRRQGKRAKSVTYTLSHPVASAISVQFKKQGETGSAFLKRGSALARKVRERTTNWKANIMKSLYK